MNYFFSLNQPLQSIFWPQQHKLIKQFLLVVIGTLALAISAHLSIPFQPVPLTFQSATVILIGMTFGARLGASVVITYLIAGFCGLPVFANVIGGFGPTSGYLIGFLPAVIVTGYLAQKGWASNIISSFIAACLGAAVIFLLGVSMLATFIGWHKAFLLGVVPFLITEPIKLLVASCITPKIWKRS